MAVLTFVLQGILNKFDVDAFAFHYLLSLKGEKLNNGKLFATRDSLVNFLV